jgi:hypothetical protein
MRLAPPVTNAVPVAAAMIESLLLLTPGQLDRECGSRVLKVRYLF